MTLAEKGALVSVIVICLWAIVALWKPLERLTSTPIVFVVMGIAFGLLLMFYLGWTDQPGFDGITHAVMLAFITLGLGVQQAAIAYVAPSPYERLLAQVDDFKQADCRPPTEPSLPYSRATVECRSSDGIHARFSAFGSNDQAKIAYAAQLEKMSPLGYAEVSADERPGVSEYYDSEWSQKGDAPDHSRGKLLRWRSDETQGIVYVDDRVLISFVSNDRSLSRWAGLKD